MNVNQAHPRTNQWRRRRDSNPRIEVLQTSVGMVSRWVKSSKAAHAAHPLLRMRYVIAGEEITPQELVADVLLATIR